MTFKDSGWLMSLVVPHAPHFEGQPEDVYTLWGYGLFVDRDGDFVGKPMARATGREILTETATSVCRRSRSRSRRPRR